MSGQEQRLESDVLISTLFLASFPFVLDFKEGELGFFSS
jgi:hypothetical protein